jgi:hypothetical protein
VRTWQRARGAVFSEEVAATSLVRTPFDLRQAAVSTWLNGGCAAHDGGGVGGALGGSAAQDLREVP